LAPGEQYCTTCGTPVPPPEPVPPHSEEWLAGEILSAYSITLTTGPVRISFTDRRVLVHWIGPSQLLPGPRLYAAWKSTLGGSPILRSVGRPWQEVQERLAWGFENTCVESIQATRERGIGIDSDVCHLRIRAAWGGITSAHSGPEPWPRLGPKPLTVFWRVPGSATVLADLLRRMPIAFAVPKPGTWRWHRQ
jgi:hypothetical protein